VYVVVLNYYQQAHVCTPYYTNWQIMHKCRYGSNISNFMYRFRNCSLEKWGHFIRTDGRFKNTL
jgi:hypothetical protein